MIWLRRVLAIPLIILFVITFVLGLVLCHLSGTVGSAGFYNGQMRKAHVYDWIYDSLMPAALDEAGIELPTDFPIDEPELQSDIIAVARQAFPPDEWLRPTFENATRQVVPYVMGDKNDFTITITVQSRIDPMAEGIKGVVDEHQDEIYDYVTAELIVPAVTEQLDLGAVLPYGITLSDQEISDFVGQAMTQGWAIEQFKSMIDTLAAYLKGGTSLNLNIGLTQVKSNAATALNGLVDDKLRAAFDSLPTCDLAAFNTELASLSTDNLPSCRPLEPYSYEQFKQALETKMGMTFADAVNRDVISLMPNSYLFDDAQLREALGEDLVETLDDAREFIAVDHGQVTREDLFDSDDTGEFDDVRHAIHTVKVWIWAFWIGSILLLVAIGFLCGRNWKSRLLWPLCVLLVTSLILVIVVAVARTFVPDRIVDPSEDATQVELVMADKADEVASNAINAIVWGLEFKLILFIVLSGLAVAGVIAWAIIDRRKRQKLAQNEAESFGPSGGVSEGLAKPMEEQTLPSSDQPTAD